MLINYFKIAFRILWNSKTFSLINIFGLAIGLAASLMIVQYIFFEKSFDQFHKKKDNLYFLSMLWDMPDGTQDKLQCHPAIGPLLDRELPEIEEYCRILHMGKDLGATVTNVSGEKPIVFYDSEFIFSDKNFFETFSFELLEGDPSTVLENDYSVVLTQSTASKYFPEESAVGKRLTAKVIFANTKPVEFIVSGIVADPPINSSIKFSMVFTFMDDWRKRLETTWLNPVHQTIVKLNEQADPVHLQQKFRALIETPLEAIEEEHGLTENVIISPLNDLHFYSDSTSSLTINTSGDKRVVKLFTLIAILIMFIAWVNYINLTTVRSVKRAKEIGIRKVSGADRTNLIIQFLVEAFWINMISIVLALTLVQLCFPLFSMAIGTETEFYLWKEEFFWIGIFSFMILSSLITGLYPAFIVSSFKPATVLKGKFGSSSRGRRFRRALVVTQFFVSLLMITGTYCVHKQINFLQYYETGIDIEKVLVLRAPMGNATESVNNYNLFKNRAMELPNIKNVAASWTIPGEVKPALQTFHRKEKPIGNLVALNGVSRDFIDTYGLKLKAGRNFSEDIPSDKTAIIATPAALEKLGFDQPEDALNTYIDYPRFGTEHLVIGVLEDYNHYTAKLGKTDFMFMLSPIDSGFRLPHHYSLKLQTSDIKNTISQLENIWNTVLPETPFDYFFMDDYFNSAFKTERQFGGVFIFFAMLTLFIAFMGLFGLSSFNTIQRTKEIGIRKVLGSRTRDILSLFTVDYLKLIVISAILSTPLVYWGLYAWLEEYPNRIELKADIFIIPIVLVLMLTIATVAYQTIRITISNPVKSLRTE